MQQKYDGARRFFPLDPPPSDFFSVKFGSRYLPLDVVAGDGVWRS